MSEEEIPKLGFEEEARANTPKIKVNWQPKKKKCKEHLALLGADFKPPQFTFKGKGIVGEKIVLLKDLMIEECTVEDFFDSRKKFICSLKIKNRKRKEEFEIRENEPPYFPDDFDQNLVEVIEKKSSI
jgi:hypothetical protein